MDSDSIGHGIHECGVALIKVDAMPRAQRQSWTKCAQGVLMEGDARANPSVFIRSTTRRAPIDATTATSRLGGFIADAHLSIECPMSCLSLAFE